MKRRPILRGILSAGVMVQFSVLLFSVPLRAQTGVPSQPGMSSGTPFGSGSADSNFSTFDSEAKPETHVLSADHAPGDVYGVARYPSGLPMAGARIVILNADVDVERSTVSAEDGSYTFKSLKPGHYQMSARIDGYASTGIIEVDVIPGKRVNSDISLKSDRSASILRNSGSGYRTYNGDYRAEPASLRVADPQPTAEGGSEGTVRTAEATSAATSSETPKTAETPSSQPIPAAVADELAAMRRRIDELESELKGRVATDQPAAAAAVAPKPDTPPAPMVPEALQAPEETSGVDNFTPFAYADYGWMNGTSRATTPIFDTKFFTPEIRFDTYFDFSFNHPIDHTLGGSSEVFRSGEFQVEQASFGGDFHWHDVRGRIILMNGMFATTTPRNDASAGVGAWDVRGAYKYISEAYGGYHFNVNHGLNIDAGIFVSYIGLFSYYNFDNWTYQPSYVSSNTPWFFNGLRIQWFPTNKLKIEPWIINGWQSYNKFNARLGFGGQILWRPTPWLGFVFNNYGMGTDNLFLPGVSRIHTDDSVLLRYYNHPDSTGLSKIAMSFTGNLGCQYGPGVTCYHNGPSGPKDSFAGWMLYNRFWFDKDKYAITLGGGRMANAGRYLTLLPPINGADAISGSPYFTANPGQAATMWDSTVTLHWMPKTWITWWLEGGYRHSNVPYWSGHGGITPPGGLNGSPQLYACTNGTFNNGTNFADTFLSPTGAGFEADNGGIANTNGAVDRSCVAQAAANPAIGAAGAANWHAWEPDLRKDEAMLGAGVMVKF